MTSLFVGKVCTLFWVNITAYEGSHFNSHFEREYFKYVDEQRQVSTVEGCSQHSHVLATSKLEWTGMRVEVVRAPLTGSSTSTSRKAMQPDMVARPCTRHAS